jgi:hypothetical protein
MSEIKISVARRALEERIRRKVYKENGWFLHKSRGRDIQELGPYYHTDGNNHVCGPYVPSLEEYGRDLGVLKPFEKLAEE